MVIKTKNEKFLKFNFSIDDIFYLKADILNVVGRLENLKKIN